MPTAVVVAMVTAVVVNVTQFPVLELETSTPYEAIAVKDGHGLLPLVEGHFESTQERFRLYIELRELAGGADLVYPPGGGPLVEQLRGLGLTGELTQADVDPMTPDERARADRAAVSTGVDRALGPYVLSLLDGAVEQLVVVPQGDITYVVDARLLDAGAP